MPTHITIHPPSDSRKRAVEKFAFTKVFEEQAEQIDIFRGTGVVPLIEGVLGEGRDGLMATLGVTGSGKVGSSQCLGSLGGMLWFGLMCEAESYDTGIEIAERADAIISGSAVPFSRNTDAASSDTSIVDRILEFNRRLRSPDLLRLWFPR